MPSRKSSSVFHWPGSQPHLSSPFFFYLLPSSSVHICPYLFHLSSLVSSRPYLTDRTPCSSPFALHFHSSWFCLLPSCVIISCSTSTIALTCAPTCPACPACPAFSARVHGAAQPAAGLLHPHPPVQGPARVRLQHRRGESTAGVPAGVQRHTRRTTGTQHR